MKKIVFLVLLSFNGILLSQSTEYTGTVKSKQDNLPLPGVNVVVKGTQIGTQTDFDGNFKINVPDTLNVLSFTYLGFQALEFKLKNKQNIEIVLKEACLIHWFDQKHIGFYLHSGLINNVIGGQLHFSFTPDYSFPTIKTGISYQTNLKANRFLNAYLNLHHLFVSCDFNADINSSYRNLDFDRNIELSSYSVETSFNFNHISAIIGLSSIDYNKISENKNIDSVGPTFGLSTWIGQPFLMSVSAKTTIYKNLSEYHAEIKKDYRGFYGFLKYYKVNNFNELSLGIGIELSY